MSTARIPNGDTLLDRRKIPPHRGLNTVFDEWKPRINETRRKIHLLMDKLEPFKEGHPDAISTDEDGIWWALNWMSENIAIWQTSQDPHFGNHHIVRWVASKQYPSNGAMEGWDNSLCRVLGSEKSADWFIVMPSEEGVRWLNEVYRWCYGIEERDCDEESDDGLNEFLWENA